MSENDGLCGECGKGIHLEESRFIFGMVSVWVHDSWDDERRNHDPYPAALRSPVESRENQAG